MEFAIPFTIIFFSFAHFTDKMNYSFLGDYASESIPIYEVRSIGAPNVVSNNEIYTPSDYYQSLIRSPELSQRVETAAQQNQPWRPWVDPRPHGNLWIEANN